MKTSHRDIVGIVLYMSFSIFLILIGLEVYSFVALNYDISKERNLFLLVCSALLLAAASLTWSKGRNALRYLILMFVLVEGSLQALAFFDVLPGISMFRHIPFGRVYYTREGRSNSVMNRYGWHKPAFRFREGATRVAVIGDSFVEGLQVAPDQTLPARLHDHLETKNSGHYDVVGFGRSGFGPVQYYELVRYAHEYFTVDEVIVMLFVGNDFQNLVRALNVEVLAKQGIRAERMAYYDLGDDGKLIFPHEDQEKLTRYRRRLEKNHEPLAVNLTTIIRQHLLTRKVEGAIAKKLKHYLSRQLTYEPKQSISKSDRPISDRISTELETLGLKGVFYEYPLSKEAEIGFTLAKMVFAKMKQFCDENNMTLHVVWIPSPPKAWFEYIAEEEFTWEIDSWDFAQPERHMRKILAELGVTYLETGRKLETKSVDIERIKSLRFRNGTGHFTEAGHELFARMIVEHFYQ